MKNFVRLIYLWLIIITCSMCQIIRPLTENDAQTDDDEAYHIAQISPPGIYRIIIWSQLIGHHFFSRPTQNDCDENEIFFKTWMSNSETKLFFQQNSLQQQNFDQLAKCFVHFYTVLTDENGQFLLQKNGQINRFGGLMSMQFNFHIIPLKTADRPCSCTPTQIVAVQQIFAVAKHLPVDTLCNFHTNDNNNGNNHQPNGRRQCILNYFQTFEDKKQKLVNCLRRWLFGFSYIELADVDNFFLKGILKELLNECKSKWISGHKIDDKNANLIGVFSDFLGDKRNKLVRTLRLADEQMVTLIGTFCEIDLQFLFSHQSFTDQIQWHNFEPAFCDHWPALLQKSLRYTQEATVLEAFSSWLQPAVDNSHLPNDEQISPSVEEMFDDEKRQIIKIWVEIISERMSDKMNNWPELDKTIFTQIGQMLATAINSGTLTMPRLDVVAGTRAIMENICNKFNYFWTTKIDHQQLDEQRTRLLSPWQSIVCAHSKFQYIQSVQLSISREEAAEDTNSSSSSRMNKSPKCNKIQNESDKMSLMKCIVCCEENISTVFLPCRHSCTCQECAQKIGEKCPICRSQISSKMQIILPF